jgi:hypothetical protein
MVGQNTAPSTIDTALSTWTTSGPTSQGPDRSGTPAQRDGQAGPVRARNSTAPACPTRALPVVATDGLSSHPLLQQVRHGGVAQAHWYGVSTTAEFKTAAQAKANTLPTPVDLTSFWSSHRIEG